MNVYVALVQFHWLKHCMPIKFSASSKCILVCWLCQSSKLMLAKLDKCFEQEKFYNQQTRNMSRASIVNEIVKFVTKAVGNSYHSSVEAGFNDRKTDLTTRVSFKVKLNSIYLLFFLFSYNARSHWGPSYLISLRMALTKLYLFSFILYTVFFLVKMLSFIV